MTDSGRKFLRQLLNCSPILRSQDTEVAVSASDVVALPIASCVLPGTDGERGDRVTRRKFDEEGAESVQIGAPEVRNGVATLPPQVFGWSEPKVATTGEVCARRQVGGQIEVL